MAKPYAVLRVLTDMPWDTVGAVGDTTTLSFDIYTEGASDGQVEEAGDAVKAALHRQPLTVTGVSVVMMVYEMGGLVGDPDPAVQHYTSRYRILSNPTS